MDANSYADAVDGDAYHDRHLYATAWTGATADRKAAALVMATRLIDSQFQFNGKAECKDVDCPCYVTGDLSVVGLLWANPQGANANFGAFSLQDAIDYSKFLIRTTADFQRFSGNMPTVGGEIDIALVTNHRGFRWIAQKELYRKLDAEKG